MQKKLILVFPGQGSQYLQMDKVPRAILGDRLVDEIWEEVCDELKYDLKKIVNIGPSAELTLTQNTQPALIVASHLFQKVLNSISNHPVDLVLGHSLGEYSALLCAQSLTLKDAVKITHLRGLYMQEAVAPGLGSMIAILKCPKDYIISACEAVSNESEQVNIANDNSPDQVVISGNVQACNNAVEWLQNNVKEKIRSIPLQVSAPFHSMLMKPAAEKLKLALDKIEIRPNQLPYVSNVDAEINPMYTASLIIKKKLVTQVCGTVKWVDSCRHISEQDKVIEVGAGSVLGGLIKKIHPNLMTLSMDKETCLNDLKNYLIEMR